MSFRIILNIIKEGFKGLWKNRNTALASLGSITAVIIILGLIMILILSTNNVLNDLKTSIDEIEVFLTKEITLEEINKLEEELNKKPGLISVTFISKDKRLKTEKDKWGENAFLLESLEKNPMQDSFKLKLHNIQQTQEFTDYLANKNGVETVISAKDAVIQYLKIVKYLRLGGLGIIFILLAITVFIIYNTVKIALTTREQEIGIMRYLGASNFYIKTPFIIEGMLIGFLASALAVAIIYFAYDYFYSYEGYEMHSTFLKYLSTPKILLKDLTVIFSVIGIGMGAIGSILSTRKYLRV